MSKLSPSLQSDGRILEEKFTEADGLISAGELNYGDFSTPIVRKVVYLQNVFLQETITARYDDEKISEFRTMAKHFLTELKDGALTDFDRRQMGQNLNSFPRLNVPKK